MDAGTAEAWIHGTAKLIHHGPAVGEILEMLVSNENPGQVSHGRFNDLLQQHGLAGMEDIPEYSLSKPISRGEACLHLYGLLT